MLQHLGGECEHRRLPTVNLKSTKSVNIDVKVTVSLYPQGVLETTSTSSGLSFSLYPGVLLVDDRTGTELFNIAGSLHCKTPKYKTKI